MEIKIQCACGAKYKFDVEPVGGRMPFAVNCPQCSADGAAQANEIIAQSVGTARFTATPAPVAPPTEVAPPPAGAVPPPAPQPPAAAPTGRLRLSHAPPPPRPTPEPASEDFVPPPPPPVRPMSRHVQAAEDESSSAGKIIAVVIVFLVFAALGFGVWKFGDKIYKRVASESTVGQILSEAKAEKASAEDEKNNFWFDDATVLFIRHTNHSEVAKACVEYWKDKLHQPLLVIRAAQDEYGQGQYELWPEHNGWVRLFGGLDWQQGQYEGLAQHLSQKYGTLVFEVRDVDFSGAYHFGVYEQGTRKFHAQMEVKITNDDAQEIVTTEGDDWAKSHGYKPGPEGFKEFHLGDADKIAQKLGLKTWDEKPDDERKGLWLREARANRSN